MPRLNPHRVLIADDHYVVRMGLGAVIRTIPGFEVCGEASDGVEAVSRFQQLKPELVLMDIKMPNADGIEATKRILALDTNARVLIVSALEGDNDVYTALEAGALGYVLKNAPDEELAGAMRAVVKGSRWLSDEARQVLQARKSFETLTQREVEVLQKLSFGLSNKQIAETLRISEFTVKDHISHLLGKLRAEDRVAAVRIGVQRGLIKL